MPAKPVSQQEPQFSKLRTIFWPIQRTELKKFLPLSLMMAFTLVIYYIVRCTKDAQVVSASGAEALPFLKTFGVVPFSILFFIFFSKINNKLTREKVFYVCTGIFLAFFAAFALFLYPNREALSPSEATIDSLKEAVPPLTHVFSLLGDWTSSLFYISAELWGSVALALLFWQFANEITRTNQAARFYTLLPLLGNVVLIFGGQLINLLSSLGKAPGRSEEAAWGVSLYYLMGAVVITGLALMFTYRWMNRNVLTDPMQYDGAGSAKKKTKLKLSIGEALKEIGRSKYLRAIAALVVCYGITIALVEITWKSQLKLQFPVKNDYNAFMGNFTSMTAIATVLCILFVNGVIRRFGWRAGAMLTPAVLLITGALFYVMVIFNKQLDWMTAALGMTPVLLAVIFGTIQNFLSKATKYSLFDPTKEMAYIPLDPEMKAKGKAAVDVIGGRFGKSGGSIIQIILLTVAGAGATAMSLAPAFAIIMVGMSFYWIFSVSKLSKLYKSKVEETELEKALEAVEAPVSTTTKDDDAVAVPA